MKIKLHAPGKNVATPQGRVGWWRSRFFFLFVFLDKIIRPFVSFPFPPFLRKRWAGPDLVVLILFFFFFLHIPPWSLSLLMTNVALPVCYLWREKPRCLVLVQHLCAPAFISSSWFCCGNKSEETMNTVTERDEGKIHLDDAEENGWRHGEVVMRHH